MPVRVLVDGLGDIAPIVKFDATKLQIAAQGEASPGLMIVRDVGLDPVPFVTGARVSVDLGSGTDPLWAGYLQRASRRFWFPVDDPEKLHRQWILSLADINILFSKRVVFSQSTPARVKGPVYTTDTFDDTVIATLVSDWLDLSADDLDTSSKVERVGHINAGQAAYPFNGGEYWGQAMTTIAQLPAAIFCLSPSRELVYADVDVEDAPFELSDHPSGAQRGYREATIWEDATQLGNDALSWGFGKGDDKGVFNHTSDDDSIAEHGLWQIGTTLYDVWKQSTIDKIGDSIVNGSPGSRRGHAKDVESMDLVTFDDGLRVGQRVRVIREEYGFDEVLPIRKMQLEFPTPGLVKYTMKLSEALDMWGFADPFPPFPGFHGGGGPGITVIDVPPTTCYFADDFNRADGPLGIASSGLAWYSIVNSEVISDHGVIHTDNLGDGINPGMADILFGINPGTEFTASIKVHMTVSSIDPITDLDGVMDISWWIGGLLIRVFGNGDGSNSSDLIISDPDGNSASVTLDSDLWESTEGGAGEVFLKVTFVAGQAKAKAWMDGDTEPDWLVSLAATFVDFNPATSHTTGGFKNDTSPVGTATDEVIDYIEICNAGGSPLEILDTFTRSVSGSWGTTDSGHTWINNTSSETADVDGSKGTITDSVTDTGGAMTIATPGSPSNDVIVEIVDIGDDMDFIVAFDNQSADAAQRKIVYSVTGRSVDDLTGILRAIGGDGSQNTNRNVTLPAYVRAVADGSGVRGKIWSASGTEPTSWQAVAPGGDSSYPVISLGWRTDGVIIDLAVDNLNAIRGASRGGGSFPPGSGSGASIVYGDGVTTTFSLGGSFSPGSSEVWVDESRSRLNIDYTENPTAGTITFVTPPGAGVPVVTLIQTAGASPVGSTFGYGSGINADTKANLQNDDRDVSHRFRSIGGVLNAVRWQQRGGSGGYSLGTGGTYDVTIEADDGNGHPDGSPMATESYTPGNSGAWTHYDEVTFSSAPTLVAGQIYYVVFHNTDGSPNSNFVSVNELFVYGSTLVPRQPFFADSDYAVLHGNVLQPKYTADMDLTYASGAHQGMGYVQNMIDQYGVISGSSNMVREQFTVSGPTQTVSTIWVRVRRSFGNGRLFIRLEDGSESEIETVSVAADAVPQSDAGGDNGGSVWVKATFSTPHTLVNGSTYHVVLSTDGSTEYTAAPIRKGDDFGFHPSLCFSDGTGQFTTNGGSSWANLYPFDSVGPDLQFWFGKAA